MISNDAKQSYLESEGCHCPYCNSQNIDSGLVHLAKYGSWFEADVSCNDCGKSWRDIYDLSNVEELESDD